MPDLNTSHQPEAKFDKKKPFAFSHFSKSASGKQIAHYTFYTGNVTAITEYEGHGSLLGEIVDKISTLLHTHFLNVKDNHKVELKKLDAEIRKDGFIGSNVDMHHGPYAAIDNFGLCHSVTRALRMAYNLAVIEAGCSTQNLELEPEECDIQSWSQKH